MPSQPSVRWSPDAGPLAMTPATAVDHGVTAAPSAGSAVPFHDHSGPAARREALTCVVPLVVVIVAAVLLQRFAVPALGSLLGIGFVISLVVTFWGALRGVLVIEPTRFALFSLMMAALLLCLALAGRSFSMLSLFMFCLLYVPFILVMPISQIGYRRVLLAFQTVSIIVAVSAIVQFAAQFAVGSRWMFPFDNLLPAAFFIPQFNLVIEMGSGMVKSTGLWLLEPSHLSQLMAVAIIVEARWFGRPHVLALLGAGLLLAFSGTGMLLLALFLPMILITRGGIPWLVLLAVLGIGVVWLFADVFPISFFVDRLGEFGNRQASGSMRFFGPFWAIEDIFAGRPDLILTGVGPGGMAETTQSFDYAVQDSSWFKLLVEYGIVGGLPFAVFYGYCLLAGSPDRLLAAAFLFMVLFLGGFLLAYYVQFLILALIVWPRPAPSASTSPAHSTTIGTTHARRC